jgi:transaldolase
MEFFIDTANVDEIREAADMGVLDGVTTNPTLIARSGRRFEDVIREISEIVPGPVSAEVVSTDHAPMWEEAQKLAEIASNIVVKLPTTEAGIKTCVKCSEQGIKTNLTLCFTPSQALIVAKAGATYVSPFVGRLDDISTDGMLLIKQIVEIYNNFNFGTKVLVASIRHPMHLVESARLGAHVATMPTKVIKQLLKHPLTDIGLERFLKDWESVPR